jgi:zinc protease
MTAGQNAASRVPSAQGLNPVREVFPNGVAVIAKHTSRSPAVTINLAVRSGSVADPAGSSGLMYLLGRTIDRGTRSRPAETIAEELDDRGVSLNINVTRHQIFLTCTILTGDFDPVLAVIADVVRHPLFPDGEVATKKGEVITSIRQDEDSPYMRASEGLLAMLFGREHPYGRPVRGTVDSVGRLRSDDVASQHAREFGAGAATLVIVGDVDVDTAVATARRYFGDWTAAAAGSRPLPQPSAPSGRQQHVITMPNKAQADIAYGFLGVARSDPDYYAFFLMNNVLGQYGMGGRLGDSIRERQGMAYYVSSVLEANVLPGALYVRAGVAPGNVDRTIGSIDEELTRLCAEGLTQKELADSQRFLIGSMPRTLETNAGIANFLQTADFFGLGLNFDLELPELLRAVTLDEANAAARRALDPDRATIVIAGPYPSGPDA